MKPPDPSKSSLTRVTCSPYATPFLRAELEAMGHTIQEEDHVSLSIGASLEDCMALNLRLRTALHVMWMLARFRCPTPKALYNHTAAFPWETLIPNNAYFSITSNVENPKINNSMYPNLVMKDAIVDRIAKHTGSRPDSGPEKDKLIIHLYWKTDRAWIYLNTTGKWLADRGYRRLPHTAPMRETLAAAVLMGAGYDGSTPLLNPMCGSGTLAIEAALIATNRAPGLLRSNYSLLHTALDITDQWEAARRGAKKLPAPKSIPPIIATDNDPYAIDAAQRNAKVAGVDHLITFKVCDFADTPLPDQPGHIILNPEYGQRLGEEAQLIPVYKSIGDFFKQRCAGWQGHVFTASRELAAAVSLRPAKRTPFMNAQLECRLLSYELYAGTKDPAPAAQP